MPHIAKQLKKVTFSSALLPLSTLENAKRNVKCLLETCPKIITVSADSLRLLNEVVWPTLLMESISPKLEHAGWEDDFPIDNFDYIMVQLKYRKSLKTITITSNSLAEQKPGLIKINQVLFSKIEEFTASRKLATGICAFPRFNEIMDRIPQSIQDLKLMEMHTNRWPGTMENFTANKQISSITIDHLTLNQFVLSYIKQKFPNLRALYIQHASYDQRPTEQEDGYWRHLVHFASTLDNFTVNAGFKATFDLPAQLSKIKKNNKRGGLSISFGNVTEYQPCIGMLRSSCQDRVICHLELPRKDNVSQINIIIPSLFKAIVPESIVISGVASITETYNQFTDSATTQMLMPYFNIHNVSDIRHFLTKQHNNKSWRWLFYASYISECNLSGFVLAALPLPNLPVYCRKSVLRKLYLSKSIVDPRVLPELSRRLPAVDLLIFDTICFLMDDPYTLKIFLPMTRVNKLLLHVVPFFEATDKKAKRSMTGRCSLENVDLQDAVFHGKYTLKIETDKKTCVYQRDESENVKLDANPKSITQGTKDKVLIYIKCKKLKMFAIEYHDAIETISSFERFE